MLISAGEVIGTLQKYQIKVSGALHIGAHECEELGFYRQLGLAPEDVIWIDAIGSKVHEAKMKGIPNIYQAVITDSDDQTVDFHVTNNVQSSSILEFGTHAVHHPHVKFVGKLSDKSVTVDTFFQRNNLDMSKCEFWNFDIQGAEMLALKGAQKALTFAKALYLEVNTEEVYKNGALLSELDTFLEERGFTRVLINMTPYGWGDALFVRKAT